MFGEFKHSTFVTGQLVFFLPAPTITVTAKMDNPLRPGVFLDYYVGPNGKFTGQYLVVDLEDFAHKNLYYRVGPKEFKLKIHRTEVVKIAAGALEAVPLFPLTRKYRMANYTLEGIEAKGKSEVDGAKFATGDPPPFSEEDRQRKACEHQIDEAKRRVQIRF